MILAMKKTPSEVCKQCGINTYERKYFNSVAELEKVIHQELGEKISKIRHPTLNNVLILYSTKPGQKRNFALSSKSNVIINGTVYFVSNNEISLSESDCDRIISKMKFFYISKEYIATN